MNPVRKRKGSSSDLPSRKRQRTEPDLRVTVTPYGTRSVQIGGPTPAPDVSVTVTPDRRRSVQIGRPTPIPEISVTVTPDGTRSVQLGKPLLVRSKRDIRNRTQTTSVTNEKSATVLDPDVRPTPVEDMEVVEATPSATATITSPPERPVAVATYSYATTYHHLSPESDRLQVMDDDHVWLWHNSHPDCYIQANGKTGEFIRHDGTRTGEFFLKANLFTKTPPAYGDDFWLTFDGRSYKVDNYIADEPDDRSAEYVPWEHIVQHLYDHFTDFSIKEAHTFWPSGTTEKDLLKHLVDALNKKGVVDALNQDDVTYRARVRRDPSNAIKTFFLDRPVAADDKFTPDQLSDLGDLIG